MMQTRSDSANLGSNSGQRRGSPRIPVICGEMYSRLGGRVNHRTVPGKADAYVAECDTLRSGPLAPFALQANRHPGFSGGVNVPFVAIRVRVDPKLLRSGA